MAGTVEFRVNVPVTPSIRVEQYRATIPPRTEPPSQPRTEASGEGVTLILSPAARELLIVHQQTPDKPLEVVAATLKPPRSSPSVILDVKT